MVDIPPTQASQELLYVTLRPLRAFDYRSLTDALFFNEFFTIVFYRVSYSHPLSDFTFLEEMIEEIADAVKPEG